MKGFIEVCDDSKNKMLINIADISSVHRLSEPYTKVTFIHNEYSYVLCIETVEEIKAKIKEASE